MRNEEWWKGRTTYIAPQYPSIFYNAAALYELCVATTISNFSLLTSHCSFASLIASFAPSSIDAAG